jgi:DNA-binding PadR family transcriptional regulator
VSLRHALLALLSAQPMTGYDVTKRFDGSVGYMWQAPHSQIYPELRRMEEAGLLEAEELPRGSRAMKRRYSLTEAGLAELRRWIADPPAYGPERDVARLRTAYLEFGDAEVARRFFLAHLEHHEHWLRKWQAMQRSIETHENEMIAARLSHRPAEEHERIVAWKAFAYEALIARAQAEIDWARAGLELAERIS